MSQKPAALTALPCERRSSPARSEENLGAFNIGSDFRYKTVICQWPTLGQNAITYRNCPPSLLTELRRGKSASFSPFMPLHIGIVGLPNVGKSTLFNALVRAKSAEAANYPFCTIHPNVGIVAVPDPRLERLTVLVKPAKVIPTAIEFVDIAGLVKGASKGEGLGNQFLHHIREVDAVCEVVRVFPDNDVIHVDGSVDGKRDVATIETELILADLQTLEKRIGKTSGGARTGNKEAKAEMVALQLIKVALDAGKLASLHR